MQAGIAGAGLMGRLLAWQLQQLGWQVTLFDTGGVLAENSAAFAAAGMLSPYAELQSGDPRIFKMGLDSLTLWPQWLAGLPQTVHFQQQGSLVLAHPEDQNEMQQFHAVLQAKLSGQISDQTDIQIINRDWLQQQEPDLPFDHGFFLPQEGQIDAQALLSVLHTVLLQNKATFYFHTDVKKIAPYHIETVQESYQFDWVFDCRGHGATDVFSNLRSVRGEMIYLYAPDVHITRPVRLLHPRYCLYIVPRAHHIYLVGASEIESNDHSPISVRSCLELLSAAVSVHAGFAEARVFETRTAKRAAFPDHLPQIRFEPGYIAVNGLYRHGFLIAPVLIKEVCRLVTAQIGARDRESAWKLY